MKFSHILVVFISLIAAGLLASFGWQRFSDDLREAGKIFSNLEISGSLQTSTSSRTDQKKTKKRDSSVIRSPDRSTERDFSKREDEKRVREKEKKKNKEESKEDNKEEQAPSLSSQKGIVKLASIRQRTNSNTRASLVLRNNLKEGQELNITDWRIKTNEGQIKIPQAVNFYEIGEINEEEDLVIENRESVKIYFGQRPIPDNLRVNKCLGFLNDIYDLGNFFRDQCPLPEKDSYKHLSGRCQDFINSVDRCKVPDLDKADFLKGGGSKTEECKNFIRDKFNTEFCYDRLSDSEDFLKNEWRVWIEEDSILDPRHDWVRLINKKGEIVDEHSY